MKLINDLLQKLPGLKQLNDLKRIVAAVVILGGTVLAGLDVIASGFCEALPDVPLFCDVSAILKQGGAFLAKLAEDWGLELLALGVGGHALKERYGRVKK